MKNSTIITSIHRKDLQKAEFSLLTQFTNALKVVRISPNDPVVYELGIVEMQVPCWCWAGYGWYFKGYVSRTQDAIGVSKAGMNAVCKYLRVRQPELLHVLHKFSIVGRTPQILPELPWAFRKSFKGRLRWTESDGSTFLGEPEIVGDGFVLEKRRADGNFKRR